MDLGSGMWCWCSDASYFNCCCSALMRSVNETTKVWNAFLLCLSQNEARPRDPGKKKTVRQLRFIVWQQGIIYCREKTMKFVTRHQFFSFSLAGKGGSFPSKTSDSLGTDHSERTPIKSWHSTLRLKARLHWFWFQTKEICMASSLFNTQLLKKSLKVATIRTMKLHYWGNRLRSLRFVWVGVFVSL